MGCWWRRRGRINKNTKKEMKITQGKEFKDMEWLI
jgi:hypothetical protein